MLRHLFLLISLLVLALAILLFAQWPLRDVLHAYSRQTNDLAQAIFAIYIAVAITAASRAQLHLSSAPAEPSAAFHWRRWATALCLAPWAAFVAWSFAPQLWQSLVGLERFSETGNPGYFLIKLACAILVLLALIEAVAQLVRRP